MSILRLQQKPQVDLMHASCLVLVFQLAAQRKHLSSFIMAAVRGFGF